MANGDSSLIEDLVQQLFTDTMDLICSIDNVAELFDSNNLIAIEVEDTDTDNENPDDAYKLSFIFAVAISGLMLVYTRCRSYWLIYTDFQ